MPQEELDLFEPPHRQRGIAGRRCADYAACGIVAAMPNPGLCRIETKEASLDVGSVTKAINGFGIVWRESEAL